jgi:hypothetical protein
MPSTRRLALLMVVLLAATGLLLRESLSPGWPLGRPPAPAPGERSHDFAPGQAPPPAPRPTPAAHGTEKAAEAADAGPAPVATAASEPAADAGAAAAPPAESAAASGESAEAAPDDPLDALRPCPPHPPFAPEPLPSFPGPVVWLAGYVPGQGPSDPLHSGTGVAEATYAPGLPALARAALKTFDLSGPLTPALRRDAAARQRANEADESDAAPDPFHLRFELPASAVAGRFYVLGPRGPVEARALSFVGVARFAVDRNGCEVGPRSLAAVPRIDAPTPGLLGWSARAVEWTTRRLAPGKGISIEAGADDEGERARAEVVIEADGRSVRGPASGRRIAAAYSTRAGDHTYLRVEYAAPLEPGECADVVVYQVRDEALKPLTGMECG